MNKTEDEAQNFLGRHTALSLIGRRREVWRRVPYLKENDGRAPPFVLAVGDRRRVYAIGGRLRNSVFLPEVASRMAGPRSRSTQNSATEYGRVAMAIGVAGKVPLLVAETQMGSPATQVILNEILSDELTSTEYAVRGKKISLSRKIVIRVGTAGGINCESVPRIRVGDVVNATHSIGATGTVIQALSRLDFWNPNVQEEFAPKWLKLGADFTITSEGHPRVECSEDVIQAIDSAGTRLAKNAYHKGGNVTKDSLYAERSNGIFLALCRTHNCRTTEMELSTIAVVAQQHHASFGMVSAIVGVLPGSSFAGNQRIRMKAEERAIRIGLDAISSLA